MGSLACLWVCLLRLQSEENMILDAGCGNRVMWIQKNSDKVIHLDIEKELQVKPTIYATNLCLPFPDKSFSTIFFDPPFKWNCDDHQFFSFPNREKLWEMYPDIRHDTYPPSYYGIERYKTRSELVAYIYRAAKELKRILEDEGCLWVRWCTMTSMDHNNLLSIFSSEWERMLEHEITFAGRSTGETKSFWFMLMKKPLEYEQTDLLTLSSENRGKDK